MRFTMFASISRKRPRCPPRNREATYSTLLLRPAMRAGEDCARWEPQTSADSLSAASEDCTRCGYATCHGSNLSAAKHVTYHQTPGTDADGSGAGVMLGELAPLSESNDAVEHVSPPAPGPGWEATRAFRRFRRIWPRQAWYSPSLQWHPPFLTG